MNLIPISKKSRIEVVDALRGFALLGIIIANIPFADEKFITGNLDSISTFLYHFLIDKKFITIFSILFGFGFYIQIKRAEAKNVNFIRYFTFRMFLLYAIGSIHALIIWNGDILRAYALGGVLLLVVRKWPVKRLLITALIFCVILTSIFFIGNSALGWRVYNYDYALAVERILTPSFFRYLTINAIMDPWVNFFKDMPITIVFTFGNMIIGYVLAKLDFFHLPKKAFKMTNWFIIQGLTFGLASSFIYYKVIVGDIELGLTFLWLPFVITAGLILQSLMYISLFIRLYKVNLLHRLMYLFTFVGKTALSNYLLQSVLYVVLFFHCGQTLQLFGKLTIAQTFMLAIAFFLFQTALSYVWLRNQTQGPLEYVWKKLSYRTAKTA